ncbi:MAG TPA: TOBE domain-containing protein [Methylovirgula sp.]|nr:TOBE domain-containing protein [Methylovirgula sp.]
MTVTRVDALLALRADGRLLVGRDRIALLEAVIEHGSMTKAAQVAGFSYKTAWDAVQAINNLLPRPAFVTRTGGKRGGGAEVTEEGRKLIAAFHRLEDKLGRISAAIAVEGLDNFDDLLLWGLTVKLSARNVFRCTLIALHEETVDVTATLQISPSQTISAVVTHGAATDLDLAPGRRVLALVKAAVVELVPAGAVSEAGRNRLDGQVVRRIDGGVNSEIHLDIGGGKILTAIVARTSAEKLGIAAGDQLCASFEACDVMLATD